MSSRDGARPNFVICCFVWVWVQVLPACVIVVLLFVAMCVWVGVEKGLVDAAGME